MEHNIRHTFRLSDDDKLLVTAHIDHVSIHCDGVALTLSESHAEALAKALDLLNNPKRREDVAIETEKRLAQRRRDMTRRRPRTKEDHIRRAAERLTFD